MKDLVDIIQVVITVLGTIVVAAITSRTRGENRSQHSSVEAVLERVIEKMDVMESGWEKRAWAIMDGLSVPMFEADAAGNCIYVSRAWMDATGVDFRSAMGEGWLRGIHQDDRKRVMYAWENSVKDHVTFGPLLYRFGASDQEFFVEARLFHSGDGELRYIGAAHPVERAA